MICKKCQTENGVGMERCAQCGAPLVSQDQLADAVIEEKNFPMAAYTEEELMPTEGGTQKKKGKKLWLILGAAVLAVVLAVGAFLLLRKPEKNAAAQQGLRHYYESGLSFDFKAEVYEKDDGLYLRMGDEEAFIAEGATLVKSDYTRSMAGSGDALLYEIDGVLYHYDCKSGKTSEIVESFDWCNISTNGKYVVYVLEDSLYLWDGESGKLDEGTFYTCNVSDDGLVYTLKQPDDAGEDQSVYLQMYSYAKDGTKTLVKDSIKNFVWRNFSMNRTQDQIMFAAYETDGTAAVYVSIDGAPARKIIAASTTYEPTLALGNAPVNQAYNDQYYGAYDVEDLCGQVYEVGIEGEKGEMSLIYVDEAWNAQVLLSYSAYTANMFYERSTDNRYIYANYSKAGALYRIDVKTGETEQLLESVLWFCSAGDGSVYYSDAEWTLWHLAEREPTKIASNVERTYLATDDGGVLYYGKDGELWLKQQDKEAEQIAVGVTALFRDGQEFIYKNDEGKHYSTDGRSVTLR